jgi:hypothetical protein
VFEVELDGELIFSKKASGRHTFSGEVVKLLEDKIQVEDEPGE